jgi:hypothetical protein
MYASTRLPITQFLAQKEASKTVRSASVRIQYAQRQYTQADYLNNTAETDRDDVTLT